MSMQQELLENDLPLVVKSIVPAGVLGVPGEVSFTEAVQVEDWPIWTEAGLQTIMVEVVRLLMARVVVAVVVWRVESFVMIVTVEGALGAEELLVGEQLGEARDGRPKVHVPRSV